MKIAVAMDGQGPEARVDARFGRAACFALTDDMASDVQWLPGPGTALSGGAGVGTAQSLVQSGAEAVIAGNFGPNATSVLSAAGVRLYSCSGLTLHDALEAVAAGKVPQVTSPTVNSHWADAQTLPAPGPGRRGGGRRADGDGGRRR